MIDEFHRYLKIGGFKFVSTDGENFTLQSSPTASWIQNWFFVKPNPEDESCPRKVSGYGIMTSSKGTVKLNHATEIAQIHLEVPFNSYTQYGAAFWCEDRGQDTNASTIVLDMELKLNYNPETVASIQLEATPSQISSVTETSNLDVTPSNLSQPWTMKITKPSNPNSSGSPDPYAACTEPAPEKGIGHKSTPFPSDYANLANGTYTFEASYDNDLGIKSNKKEVVVNIAPLLSVSPDSFRPGASVAQFQVKAVKCPDWTLTLKGVQDSLDGSGAACTWTKSGSGDATVTWDGSCPADTDGTIRFIAAGSYPALLVQGNNQTTKQVNVGYPIGLTVSPEFISPANQDGQFDTAQFNVTASPGQLWTLYIDGVIKTFPEGVGSQVVTWDGRDNSGAFVADGAYTVHVASGSDVKTDTINIDNTPLEFFDIQSQDAGNQVIITAKVRDPIVNGVSSGIDGLTTLELAVSNNNQTIQVASAELTDGSFGLAAIGANGGQSLNLSVVVPKETDATYLIAAKENVRNKGNVTVNVGTCSNPQMVCVNLKLPTGHPVWDPKKNLPRTPPNPVTPGKPGQTGGSLAMVMLQDNNLNTPGLTIGLAVTGGQRPKNYAGYKTDHLNKSHQGLPTPESISVSVSKNAQTVLNVANAKVNPQCRTSSPNRNFASEFKNDVADLTMKIPTEITNTDNPYASGQAGNIMWNGLNALALRRMQRDRGLLDKQAFDGNVFVSAINLKEVYQYLACKPDADKYTVNIAIEHGPFQPFYLELYWDNGAKTWHVRGG